MKTLQYYFEDGTLVVFDKYTIDTNGVIHIKKTGKVLRYYKSSKCYNAATVCDNLGKSRGVLIGRAIASTFIGPPATLKHTADHKDRIPTNDTLSNIRWLDKSGQRGNQDRPKTHKTAFIIVKDGLEKTTNEWVDYLKNYNNIFDRPYTWGVINKYAQKKQHGFSFKQYPDLVDEVWKKITGSETTHGRWEISNMNRVKYITKYAENVLSDERIGLWNGYPKIVVGYCHVLAFAAFFPEEWASKKSEEIVLHEDDDKLDFSPHKLRLGTRSENGIDAYNNGCHTNKASKVKCVSYIKGDLEKEYNSQADAANYLKTKGFDKADQSGIGQALKAYRKGEILTRYGRTWRTI